MARIVRVRFEKGVFKPLERVDFREGEELRIVVLEERRFTGFTSDVSRYRFTVDSDVVEEYVAERR